MDSRQEVRQALNEAMELHHQLTTHIQELIDKRHELGTSIDQMLAIHKELVDCG